MKDVFSVKRSPSGDEVMHALAVPFQKSEGVSTAQTLTELDSGTVYYLTQTTSAFAISLPNAADAGMGWWAEFIVTAIPGSGTPGAITIIATDDDGDNMHGHGIDGEDGAAQTVSEGTGFDVVTLINGVTVGDRVKIQCDGARWFVLSFAADKAHITFS
jgi:hypothetical protein